MSKSKGRTAQPKKRAGDSSVETDIFISEDEEFYMTVEPHMHSAGVGKDFNPNLESVHININTENVDLTLSLPIKAFIKLTMMALYYGESKQRIVATPGGSFCVGEICDEQKLTDKNFVKAAIGKFMSLSKTA